ncbi:MAG: ATP-binding protein [Methanomicrobiales archaeon]|nr:ATP-binding protein [Methanomicrobiales archaeon]
MKIRTQVVAGTIIFALLLLVVSGLVVATNQKVERLIDQETIANEIALEVGELGYLSNDYILYREPQQEDRWNAKFTSITGHIESLSVDTTEQQAIVGNLRTNLGNTKAVFDDIVSSPHQSEGTGFSFVQLSWSRMAVQNQGMVFDAGRLASLLRFQTDGLRETRTLLIFALVGAFVAFLLSSYVLFYRRTLTSISRLQEGSRIIGSGNLEYAIEQKGDDEISELARSFNRMTSDLRQVIATKSDLEKEITGRKEAEEQLVQANAQLRESKQNLIQQNDELNELNEELVATQEELRQNVEELIQVQQDLRKSEGNYRNLFERMTEGFAVHEIVCDDQGVPKDYRFLEINPAFEQLTGLKRNDTIGKLVSEVLPGTEQFWIDRLGAVALTGRPDHLENYSATLGKYYSVFAYSPVHRQFVVMFNDITERKRAEEALKEYTESLKRSNEDLERFAYIASHDLQEPLRNVVSFSQLLSRRYKDKLSTDADEYLGYIVEGGKRMQILVQDLLEYSRVNTRGQAFMPVECEPIVEKVTQNLQSQIQDSDAVIVTGPLPTVLADPSQLYLVFQNLVGNAIKFHRESTPPRIRISAEKTGKMWKFAVRDNGIGIDSAYYQRIFEIFQRLHTREKYPGTGVGLAIVKKIIERHGGEIWVESDTDKGSTFYFTVPAPA